MPDSFFGDKFDDFRVEVIDRLARMETKHDRIIERLDKINGTMEEHGDSLEDHERKISRMRGAVSVLAALIGAAISVIVSRLRSWLAS